MPGDDLCRAAMLAQLQPRQQRQLYYITAQCSYMADYFELQLGKYSALEACRGMIPLSTLPKSQIDAQCNMVGFVMHGNIFLLQFI